MILAEHYLGIGLTLIITLILGAFFQYKLLNTGSTMRLLSAPSFRRRHRQAIPLTGGIGMFATIIFGLLVVAPYCDTDKLISMWPIALGATSMFAVGLVDDLIGLRPKTKLLGELLSASLVLIAPDVQAFAAGWYPHLGYAIYPLIVFWIVGVTNAINLIDGLDGLAGSYAALALAALSFQFAWWWGNQTQVVVLFVLIASILPFLYFNSNPARVFMGDNGSLLLGFLISTFAILKPSAVTGYGETMSIIFIAGFPILDMGLVSTVRILKGFSPFTADRSHLHYRLLKFHLSVKEVVSILMSLNVIFLFASIMLKRSTLTESFVITALIGAVSYMTIKMTTNFDRWKTKVLTDSFKGPSLVEGPKKKPTNQLLIDLKPIFQAFEKADQSQVNGAIQAFSGYLRLKFPESAGFQVWNSRTEYYIGLPGEPDEYYNDAAEAVKNWLMFHDIAVSLPNLPIYIVELDQQAKKLKQAA